MTRQSLPSILIVEDDTDIRKMMGVIVAYKYPDAAVHLSSDGKLGIDLFLECLPDVVITDINMPEMNGVEMAYEMWSLKKSTRFIAVSANSDPRYRQELEHIGVRHFICKPIQLSKLFTAIDNCLSGPDPGSMKLGGRL